MFQNRFPILAPYFIIYFIYILVIFKLRRCQAYFLYETIILTFLGIWIYLEIVKRILKISGYKYFNVLQFCYPIMGAIIIIQILKQEILCLLSVIRAFLMVVSGISYSTSPIHSVTKLYEFCFHCGSSYTFVNSRSRLVYAMIQSRVYCNKSIKYYSI